ncbi:MAG: Mur ligase domain-containing protein [Eubacteriales bacterium]|nr:Mur ligase domain-containing protein [Eubacteriales bacterium]
MDKRDLGNDFKQTEHLRQIDELLRQALLSPGKRVFFIGIAGISMLGLAEIAASHEMKIAGSDIAADNIRTQLESLNATVYNSHDVSHIQEFKPDLVVYTLAIPADNPELQIARELGIPTVERAVFLGAINRQYRRVINIAGTNGKTTTTALCSQLLVSTGFDPAVHLGAEYGPFNGTVRISDQAELMVSEACEFGGSFLSFRSTSAVILNIDHDHVDIFPDLRSCRQIFCRFALSLDAGACLILPTFEVEIANFLTELLAIKPNYPLEHPIFLYGYAASLRDEAKEQVATRIFKLLNRKQEDLSLIQLSYEGPYAKAQVAYQADSLSYQLAIPGKFNLENSLAAISAALVEGAKLEALKEPLENFHGAEGRFTLCGQFQGADIIADYAHYAESLKLTLEAAKQLSPKRLVLFFQPITFSRARANAEGFYQAAKLADEINFLEVYDNREQDRSFSTSSIVDRLQSEGYSAKYLPDLESAEKRARSLLQAGDLALFIGASVRRLADQLAGRKH